MAKIQDFDWWQGNDGILDFDVDPATTQDALASLSGCTIRWQLFSLSKGVPNVGQPLVQKVSPTQITITDAAAMTYTVPLIRSDTLALPPGDYYHEAEVQDASGNRVTTTTGIMKLFRTAIR